jgi:hypothetical protein
MDEMASYYDGVTTTSDSAAAVNSSSSKKAMPEDKARVPQEAGGVGVGEPVHKSKLVVVQTKKTSGRYASSSRCTSSASNSSNSSTAHGLFSNRRRRGRRKRSWRDVYVRDFDGKIRSPNPDERRLVSSFAASLCTCSRLLN